MDSISKTPTGWRAIEDLSESKTFRGQADARPNLAQVERDKLARTFSPASLEEQARGSDGVHR